jgi:hypothetical protein
MDERIRFVARLLEGEKTAALCPQPSRRSESLPLPQLVLILELAVEAVPVDEILLPVLGAPSVASATIWRLARCPQDCLEDVVAAARPEQGSSRMRLRTCFASSKTALGRRCVVCVGVGVDDARIKCEILPARARTACG